MPDELREKEQFCKVNDAKLNRLIEKLKAKKRNANIITVFISSPLDGCDDERNAFKIKIDALKTFCMQNSIFLKVITYQWGITNHLFDEDRMVRRSMEAVEETDIFLGYYLTRYGTSVLLKPEAAVWLNKEI